MSLDGKSDIANDPAEPAEPADSGPPRLLDTSVTGDDPAAGRDGRDLLDPKNAANSLENAPHEEGRHENGATQTSGGDVPEESGSTGAAIGKVDTTKTSSSDQQDPQETHRRRPEWLVRPSAGTMDDPLLGCLAIIATLLDRQMSNEALIAGLPMAEDAMSPDLFVRAANRAGISARLVQRPLAALDTMALPCVLLLQGRRACVLTAIDKDGQAEIIMPEMGVGARSVRIDELAAV